jgi:thiamine biosynthesis lipoprotein
MIEVREEFRCFDATCAVAVIGEAGGRSAADAVALARRFLLDWHERFTRFDPTSELSRLNADPREVVPVSDGMARLAEAVVGAARLTDGLVDGTLLREVESAGYRTDLASPLPLERALELAPPRRPAAAARDSRWSRIEVDRARGTVTRPPGLTIDSGGLVKGLAADVLEQTLGAHATFAVEAAGDVRVGGAGGISRPVQVTSPFDGSILHTFSLVDAGVATSGIGRRSWLRADRTPAHHLLDPGTGEPAYTGVVQATALAPTALEAEARAKAAVLSGPERAPSWLPHGGILVAEDASHLLLL